ncbi:MAG: proteasome subunit alpha [Verrucomicrobiota bacterium]
MSEQPAFDGDFPALLQRRGHPLRPEGALSGGSNGHLAGGLDATRATTVLGFHCADGVLIAGDRRATAGNTVIYDRADKVIELDEGTILAIAGTPATAFEMARVLEHSFQYFRRSQLQPLSLEGKVRALGQLLSKNLPMTLQGVGVVVPLLAIQDDRGEPQLYFYDALGAQFQAADFAVSGSGSPAARSVLHYLNRWSPQPPATRKRDEAARLALELLDTAAESDTATGGVDRRSEIFPQVKLLGKDGITDLTPAQLAKLFGEGHLPKPS